MYCGMSASNGTDCPICKKSRKLNVLIKEIRGDYGTQEAARYSCPACQSRRVTETAVHSEGFFNFTYDLDKNEAPNQEQFARLKDMRVVNTYCSDCQITLPYEDHLNFIEESEGWLPQ